MKNLPLLLSSILLALFLSGCSKGKDSTQQLNSSLYKIDLSGDAIDEFESPKLSTFFNEIEYIKLETSEKSFVKGNPEIYVSQQYIYTVAFRQILQFDRKDGRFVKELGHYGFDPEGYIATLPNTYPFSTDDLFVSTGKYIKSISGIDNRLETVAKSIQGTFGFAVLDSNTFVSYIGNYDCNEKNRLIVYSKDGTEKIKFPNHLSCEKRDKSTFSIDLSEGQFHYLNSDVLFKESYNDTIFRVTTEKLIPHAHFYLGNKGIPYAEKENVGSRDKWDKVIVTNTFESVDYVFFTYSFKNTSFSGVFDKKKRVSYIPEKKAEQNGIVDDINGFIDFKPLTMNKENEVVSYYYPEDILEWFEERDDNQNIPESLKNLKTVKSEDNPIIAIVKLKEN
jgi:hypothetical protein